MINASGQYSSMLVAAGVLSRPDRDRVLGGDIVYQCAVVLLVWLTQHVEFLS